MKGINERVVIGILIIVGIILMRMATHGVFTN